MDLQALLIGSVSLVSGVGMLLFPRQKRLAAEAKLTLRKAQLAAGEPEAYFEERRSIEAYPLPATDKKWRIRGAVATALGVFELLLAYVH